MHVLIMGRPRIDHISGDGLDNRRANLRFASQSENAKNCRIPKNNKSGFKGVMQNPKRKDGWYVRIKDENGIGITGGCFMNIYAAAKKANEIYKTLHGEFARLNTLTPEQEQLALLPEIPYVPPIGKTGFRGVIKHTNRELFIVRLKSKHYGCFKTQIEAAKAYDRAVIETRSGRHLLNFPNDYNENLKQQQNA